MTIYFEGRKMINPSNIKGNSKGRKVFKRNLFGESYRYLEVQKLKEHEI